MKVNYKIKVIYVKGSKIYTKNYNITYNLNKLRRKENVLNVIPMKWNKGYVKCFLLKK